MKYNSWFDSVDALLYSVNTMTDLNAEFAKTTQKSLYKDIFHVYKSMNDEGGAFTNLTIEDDKMSFDTTDMGTLHLTKATNNGGK